MRRVLLYICMLIIISSMVTAQCFDSDNGKNKYEQGGVTQDGETFQDACDGENIKEYFCSVDGVASYTTLSCIYGCEEGACILGNEAPAFQAPEIEEESNVKFYGYIILIIIAIGLYGYWFWIRRKRRWR